MNIFKVANIIFSKRSAGITFEAILMKGLSSLKENTHIEISKFIHSQINNDGGFKDKAGNSDIYYSLFGYFLSRVLHPNYTDSLLKSFVETGNYKTTTEIDLYCQTILHKLLLCNNNKLAQLKRKISALKSHSEYSNFLLLVTAYYLKDYRLLLKLQANSSTPIKNKPTTVLSAELIIKSLFNQPTKEVADTILSRSLNNGGFKSSNIAPIADLLSTSTALYALNFCQIDMRQIKVNCMDYIGNLYEEGGFVATEIDTAPDVEYTFYALLGLGSLNN